MPDCKVPLHPSLSTPHDPVAMDFIAPECRPTFISTTNTHLIAHEARGEKYEAALRDNVPIVCSKWHVFAFVSFNHGHSLHALRADVEATGVHERRGSLPPTSLMWPSLALVAEVVEFFPSKLRTDLRHGVQGVGLYQGGLQPPDGWLHTAGGRQRY